MIIAGIDPGKTGALAITYPDGAVMVFDVPTVKLRGKEVPAWMEWQRSWEAAFAFAGVDQVVIEEVAARPGQGVTSMFTFGRTLGFAHALEVAELVRDEDWLAERISDSLDMDWRPIDAARAIIAGLEKETA